jgi:hypothetical protein
MKEVQSTYKRRKSRQDYARREVLRMWRHFDEDALKADIPQFCLPSDCLPALFKRYKLDSQREQKQLHYAWEHTMDPVIAAMLSGKYCKRDPFYPCGKQRMALGNRPLPQQGYS